MTTLRKAVKGTHDSGSWTYGIIEDIGINTATVRLKPAGTRLTNITVAGSRVKVGDTVVIDYSSGKPVIRPITSNKYDISNGLFGFASPGFSGWPSKPEKPIDPIDISPLPEGLTTDIGVKAWAWEFEDMDSGVEYSLQFREVDYDTNNFFDIGDNENLLTKIPGLYIVLARIAFETNAIADTRYHAQVLVDGNTQASAMANTIMDSGAVPKVFEVNGTLICGIDSLVKVKVTQNNNYAKAAQAVKISMISDGTYHIYPTVQLQWIGVVE